MCYLVYMFRYVPERVSCQWNEVPEQLSRTMRFWNLRYGLSYEIGMLFCSFYGTEEERRECIASIEEDIGGLIEQNRIWFEDCLSRCDKCEKKCMGM